MFDVVQMLSGWANKAEAAPYVTQLRIETDGIAVEVRWQGQTRLVMVTYEEVAFGSFRSGENAVVETIDRLNVEMRDYQRRTGRG